MAPINASDGYGYDGYDDNDDYDDENDNGVPTIIVNFFGQSLEFIDPLEVSHFLTDNEYAISFESASKLDATYAHWNGVPIDEAEGGTHWLAAFDFPTVGDTIEIGNANWEVSWTGVLTFKAVKI